MALFERKAILDRLQTKAAEGRPIIGGGAGSDPNFRARYPPGLGENGQQHQRRRDHARDRLHRGPEDGREHRLRGAARLRLRGGRPAAFEPAGDDRRDRSDQAEGTEAIESLFPTACVRDRG